jgi:hypothetical protein
MMQRNDSAAMQAAHEADLERTKSANNTTDDATNAAKRIKDDAGARMHITADQFAQVNYTELDNRNFQKLKAEREAVSKLAATKLHDAMD